MTSVLVLVAIVASICYCFFKYLKFKKLYSLINQIPGPKCHFLLGNLPNLLCSREDVFGELNNIFKNYPSKPFVRLWFGWTPRIMINSAESAEALLSTGETIDKAGFYRFLHNWLGTGLLTSTGTKWHTRRKLLTSTFHFKILEEFFPIIQEQTNILLEILEDKLSDGKITLDIYPYLARCALDVICETAMGRTVSAQRNLDSPYVHAVNEVGETFTARNYRPWLNSDFIYSLSSLGRKEKKALQLLHSFTDQVIQERKRQNKCKNSLPSDSKSVEKKRLAFLDLLLDQSTKLSDRDVREEVDTFMFEGHDTTSSGVSWSLYCIAKYPEVQQKVRSELKELLQDDYDRPFISQDLKKMKYLECVIKESMRLFPPVPYFARRLTKDTEMCGYTIPSDVDIAFSTYTIHMDPKYYSEPEKFDPDRFRPENLLTRHPFAYIPFSAGPRNCIGQKFALMEEKTMVAQIVRNYWITLKEKDENFKMYAELILRPVNGLWLVLEKKPIEKEY
ncbi:Cytochrome P450 4V2 [Chamberlinius hualienensis]|uniref:Cytochrome P450 4GN1 n=1 Tax=Chamberlinius hualienensis TaxID=1551368 RepID=A0A1J1E8R3_9MYRI|nr:cytochrome P450 4GN1 [Chamberlinius hualienensis]